MSGKKYKKLRHEAEEHGVDYKLVKHAYRRLSTADKRRLLANI